jgi:hypothetical protein
MGNRQVARAPQDEHHGGMPTLWTVRRDRLPVLLQVGEGFLRGSSLGIGPPQACYQVRHPIGQVGILTDAFGAFEESNGMGQGPLAEIEAGERATGLSQAERMLRQFGCLDGLVPMHDPLIKLA